MFRTVVTQRTKNKDVTADGSQATYGHRRVRWKLEKASLTVYVIVVACSVQELFFSIVAVQAEGFGVRSEEQLQRRRTTSQP